MSEKHSFFSELRRRNVYKVAVAYAVISWLVVQAASLLFVTFEAPPWALKVFVIAVALGFPIALVLAWAFELTPEGITLESEVEPNKSITKKTGRKLAALTGVVGIVAAGLFVFQLLRMKPAGGPGRNDITTVMPNKSIAVLPFDNLSRDPDNAYFCEGVQDEILTRLAKVADLKVISRTSTQHFKSAPDNLPQIAKQLGVSNILEGSVQKANDQVRVNVQLINALTDAHLWGDTYDRKLTDIFTVESEIAKTIADTLQAKLTRSEQKQMAKKPTENPEAHQLYLQGRFFWNKRTAADLRKSIGYFDQALAKDPNYALAYAGLAQTWMLFPAYDGGSPADCYPQAAAVARKALELDNTLSDAITALASLKAIYEFDFTGAAREYERAIQLNPNDATAHHWFATDVLAFTGQQTRELAEMKRALELDPLSLIINSNLGMAYLHNGRLEEAIAQFRKTIELDNSFVPGHWNYALALALQGKISDAITECEKAVSTSDDPNRLGLLGYLYGLAGRGAEARDTLEKLRQLRTQRYTLAYALALASLGVNNKTEAIAWLEQGYNDRDGENVGKIRIDPLLKPLHGDPRFEALAERVVPVREFRSEIPSK